VKRNITAKSAAAPKLAGYSFNNATIDIVPSWLDCLENPDSEPARDHLARVLDQALKSHLGEDRYSGILKGRENEIAPQRGISGTEKRS